MVNCPSEKCCDLPMPAELVMDQFKKIRRVLK